MPQLRLLKNCNGRIELPLSVFRVNAQTPFTMKYHENPPCIYRFHTAAVMTCADREQLVTGSTYSEMFARINVAAAYLQQVLFARLLTVSTVYVVAPLLSPPSPLNGSLRRSHLMCIFTHRLPVGLHKNYQYIYQVANYLERKHVSEMGTTR